MSVGYGATEARPGLMQGSATEYRGERASMQVPERGPSAMDGFSQRLEAHNRMLEGTLAMVSGTLHRLAGQSLAVPPSDPQGSDRAEGSLNRIGRQLKQQENLLALLGQAMKMLEGLA